MTLRVLDIGPGLYQNLAEMDRLLIDSIASRTHGVMFSSGTSASTVPDLQVTPGSGHTVNIGVGRAVIREKTSGQTGRGSYFAHSDAVENRSLPAPGSNPFIATVIMRVYDPQYGTVTTPGPAIEVWKGTEATSPVALTDAAIDAQANTFGGWIRLADVRVNTGDSGAVPAGQVTDRRTPGGFGRINALSTARPLNPFGLPLQTIQLDDGAEGVWNPATSKWQMRDTRRQAFASAWSAQGSSVGFGSGSTHTMDYMRDGDRATIWHRWYSGATGFNGGIGAYQFSVPFVNAGQIAFGPAKISEHAVEVDAKAVMQPGSGQLMYMAPYQVGGATGVQEWLYVRNSTDGSPGQGVPRWISDYTWKQENPGYIEGSIEYLIVVP